MDSETKYVQDEQGNVFEIFQETDVPSSEKKCNSCSTTSLVVVGLLSAAAGGMLGFFFGTAVGAAASSLASKKFGPFDDQDDIVARKLKSPNRFRWASVVEMDGPVLGWGEEDSSGKQVYRAANIETGNVWPLSYGTREELENEFKSKIVPYLA
jgi:hypothetical protein